MAAEKIFIITGDYSGDKHASGVVRELLSKGYEIEGVGGYNLEKTGIKLFSNHDKMNTMGMNPVSVFNHFFLGKRIVDYLKNRFKPDLVLLVDYGAFNLAISKVLKKEGFKIFYFIPPQIWASRKWRLKTVKKNIDKVFTIFPFEAKMYEEYGIKTQYVGHPLIKELPNPVNKDEFFEKYNLDKNKKLVSVFPGSRMFEIKYLFKIFEGAAKIIEKKFNDVQIVFSLSSNLPDNAYKTNYKVIKGDNHALLSASDALILSSGTVALEAALYNIPMIIAYKGPFLFYLIYLAVRTIKKACLVNIITKKDIVPEFLMYDCKEEPIAQKIIQILSDENERNKQLGGFAELKEQLGNKHCVVEVAQLIDEELKNG